MMWKLKKIVISHKIDKLEFLFLNSKPGYEINWIQ